MATIVIFGHRSLFGYSQCMSIKVAVASSVKYLDSAPEFVKLPSCNPIFLEPMKTENTEKSAGSENAIDSISEFDMLESLQQHGGKTLASVNSEDYFLSHEGSADESSDWDLVSPRDFMTDYVTTRESRGTSPFRDDRPGVELILEWSIDPEQLEHAMADLSMQDHSENGEQVNRRGQNVFPLSSKEPRKRTRRKHVEAGHNRYGRRGTLRCEACRRRRSKCVFLDETLPCDFCRKRDIICIKKWGKKKEEVLGRPPATPIDNIISHQDVLLLQFAYSDMFTALGGSLISNLFRKFAYIFNPSINNESLRQVTLAWAAAFFPHPSKYDRMKYYSTCAGRALCSKTPDTIDESDIYTVSLLTLLSCLFLNGPEFEIHLAGFLVIMKDFRKTLSKQDEPSQLSTIYHLKMFLPLVRDLIIEMSRALYIPNTLVIQFSLTSQQIIGPASFSGRAQYFEELFGVDPYKRNTFCNSVWHHCTVLRRCFRNVVFTQIEGPEIDPTISTLVAEARADLISSDVKTIVCRLLMTHKKSDGDSSLSEGNDDAMEFALLLYAFCNLLIVLLQHDTLIQGLFSSEACRLARSTLKLVDDRWLDYVNLCTNVEVPSPCVRRFLVIRILWTAGLTINKEEHPEIANFVVNTLELTGERHFSMALKQFWREPNCMQLGEMLNSKLASL